MDLLSHVPSIHEDLAREFLHNSYGMSGSLSELPSERDQNFLITTDSGAKYVMKIANAAEDPSLLTAQNAALDHASSTLSFCPKVLSSLDRKSICQYKSEPGPYLIRVITYIEGVPLSDAPSRDSQLLIDLGRKLGKFDQAFANFDHHAFHRDFHWDLANGMRVMSEYLKLVNDGQLRDGIEDFAKRFERNFKSSMNLRRSVIHGDANDYNIIIRDNEVVGLIDFGDMVYSYTVGDLAIALAYIIVDWPDPFVAAKDVVSGYLMEYSLNEQEIGSLWLLTLMRLCMSVCLSAHQLQVKPENKYLSISQNAIRKSLPALLRIDGDLVTDAFQRSLR
jgi:Ser/Thr protein kinase RdoA (MazF antagonist)